MLTSVILFTLSSSFILFTSSLWTLYFGLELQWMLLTIFIIIGSSVWRGLLNYLMLNAILSIWLIIGILLSNSLLLFFSLCGKVGYFPFYLILSYLYYCVNLLFILIDCIAKVMIFTCFIIIIHLSFHSAIHLYLILNFLMIIFFVKFVLSIKQVILISSLQLFLFILLLLNLSSEVFALLYIVFYMYLICMIILDTLYTTYYIVLLTDNYIVLSPFSSFWSSFSWLIYFGFIPMLGTAWLKFIFLLLCSVHSLGLVLIIVIFLGFLFQSIYIRSLVCIFMW